MSKTRQAAPAQPTKALNLEGLLSTEFPDVLDQTDPKFLIDADRRLRKDDEFDPQ